MIVIALLCALAGFAALALAMDRHGRALFSDGRTTRYRRRITPCGWAGILLCWAISICEAGPAIGSVLCIGLCSLAAAVTLLTLSWLSHHQ